MRRLRATVRSAATVIAAFAGLVALAPFSAAQTVTPGRADIVVGAGSGEPRNSGGSATEFSLRLPKGAACPGDSADGGYRVQSFMVPVKDDPASLHYRSTGPDGDGRFALYDTYSASYAQVQTANAQAPGQPGTIVNIPSFNFAVFSPGDIAAGRYHVGIACSLLNATVSYWSTDIDVKRDSGDKPAGIHWTAASPAKPTTKHRPVLAVLVFAIPPVLIAVALARLARRQQHAAN